MKDLTYLDKFRMEIPEACIAGKGVLDLRYNGVFDLDINGVETHVIAGRGRGWEHVSVSCKDRTPTWEEMDTVKRMFFEDDEVVMQLHVARKDHINFFEHCLHMWKPLGTLRKIPLPPKDLV